MGYGPINWYVSRTHLHNNRGVLGLRAGQKGGVAKVVKCHKRDLFNFRPAYRFSN